MRPLPIQMTVSPMADGLHKLEYSSAGAVSLILQAAQDTDVLPFVPIRIPTGITLGIPEGLAGHITPDPSMAERGFMAVPDMLSPDDREPITILMDYRFHMDGVEWRAFTIRRGTPIARLTFVGIARIKPVQVTKVLSGPGAIFTPPTED